jgi:hypothetical protein
MIIWEEGRRRRGEKTALVQVEDTESPERWVTVASKKKKKGTP